MDGGQPMNHSSTAQSWDTLDLHTLKKSGSEHHGPCPVTGEGKDCFWVKPDDRLIGCRSCGDGSGKLDGPQFKEHLEALGAEFGASDVLLTYDWTRPLSHQGRWSSKRATRVIPNTAGRNSRRPTISSTLARYDPRCHADDRLDRRGEGGGPRPHRSSRSADYDVIGFVSSTVIPRRQTPSRRSHGAARASSGLMTISLGAKVAARLVSALRESAGADVVTVVDPARLGLTGGHGHDAEEWQAWRLAGRRNCVRPAERHSLRLSRTSEASGPTPPKQPPSC